jgi:hypothetical protein
MFRRITKRDKPQALAAIAAKNESLLRQALAIAQRRAAREKKIIREILATGTVEGWAKHLKAKTSTVSFRVVKYKRTWHRLIPWGNLVDSTPEEEAASILDVVATNLRMTERNEWPRPPKTPAKRKTKSHPAKRART